MVILLDIGFTQDGLSVGAMLEHVIGLGRLAERKIVEQCGYVAQKTTAMNTCFKIARDYLCFRGYHGARVFSCCSYGLDSTVEGRFDYLQKKTACADWSQRSGSTGHSTKRVWSGQGSSECGTGSSR